MLSSYTTDSPNEHSEQILFFKSRNNGPDKVFEEKGLSETDPGMNSSYDCFFLILNCISGTYRIGQSIPHIRPKTAIGTRDEKVLPDLLDSLFAFRFCVSMRFLL